MRRITLLLFFVSFLFGCQAHQIGDEVHSKATGYGGIGGVGGTGGAGGPGGGH